MVREIKRPSWERRWVRQKAKVGLGWRPWWSLYWELQWIRAGSVELPKPHPSKVFSSSPPSLTSTHGISMNGQSARGRKPMTSQTATEQVCTPLLCSLHLRYVSCYGCKQDLSEDSGCFPSIENPFFKLKRKEKKRKEIEVHLNGKNSYLSFVRPWPEFPEPQNKLANKKCWVWR